MTAEEWCFGIIGLSLEQGELPIIVDESTRPVVSLRRLDSPPEELEMICAIQDKSLAGVAGRYCAGIGCELSIRSDLWDGDRAPLTLAWWVMAALRVIARTDFLVPLASDRPWDSVAAFTHGEVEILVVEDVPRSHVFATTSISTQHAEWVSSNLVQFVTLLEDPRFKLSVDALATHAQEGSLRMAAASVWVGIDAYLAVQTELRFRIAAYIASLLEERGPSRAALFGAVKKLYDVRSRVVHGAPIDDVAIADHIGEARSLLGRLVVAATEAGELPSRDHIEKRCLPGL